MKILNKFIWSKKEPSNKNDIWFDGSTWRMYTEEAWQSFTLPVDAADKVAKVLENASEVYQEKLNAGEGIIIKDNTISIVIDSQLSEISNNPVKNKTVTKALKEKINKTELATINGKSIVGGGNIIIEGGDSKIILDVEKLGKSVETENEGMSMKYSKEQVENAVGMSVSEFFNKLETNELILRIGNSSSVPYFITYDESMWVGYYKVPDLFNYAIIINTKYNNDLLVISCFDETTNRSLATTEYVDEKSAQVENKLTELSARTLYKNPLQGVTFGSSERDSVLKKVLKYIWLEVVDSSFELPKQWRFYLLRNSQAKSPQFMVQICLADSDDIVFTYSYATKVTGYAEFICNGFSTHKNKVNLHFGVDFSEFLDDINYATSFGTYINTDEVNRYEVKEDEYLNESVKKIEEKVIENSSIAQYVHDQIIVTKVDGVNLYDSRLNPTQDTLVSQNGLISSVGYNTSFPLFLKAGKYAVTHNHSSLGANAFYAEVDVNGNVISLLKGILAENNTILQVDIKNGYYRFNIGNSNQLATFMVTKDGEYPSEFVPFASYINNALVRYKDIIDIPTDNPSSNGLKGKIISFNGDSICAGSGGYGKIIAERNEMVYENIAVSGGTITAETYSNEIARHWISRTIGNMRADADFAIVEGGVNDSSLAVPLGSISNGYDATLDDTTFYGAFESMLKQLLLRFQGKKVGYIFVHQMTNNFRHLNEKEGSYYWAARMCCEKWGVPYCDLNVTVPAFGLFKSSSDMYVLTQQYTKNSDGWHPNEEGYKKYYCDKIEAWLKTL